MSMEKTSADSQKNSGKSIKEPRTSERPADKEEKIGYWEEFLTKKKVSAEAFIKRISKEAVRIPPDDERDRFVKVLVKKPDRVSRLYQLLLASAEANDSVRRIVMNLAELGIKQLGVVDLSDPPDGLKFRVSVKSWVDKVEKKPLKVNELNILFLALLWGWRCKLVEQIDVFGFLTLAVSSPKKKDTTRPKMVESNPNQMEVLFRVGAKREAIKALLEYHEVSKLEKERLDRQIQALLSEKATLDLRLDRLQSEISNQKEQIKGLKDEKREALSQIEAHKKELVDTRDGFQLKLYELRGRIRGILQGQLTRWLETALEASRDEAPWMPVIQERLEDALDLIKKESKAL